MRDSPAAIVAAWTAGGPAERAMGRDWRREILP